MAVTRDILNSHPISNLRKEIAKTNIRGYSKMTKAQLVDVMMKHKERFSHIKPHTKAPAPAPKKKERVPFKIKEKKKEKIPFKIKKKPEPKAKTPTPKAPTPKAPTPKAPTPKAKTPTPKGPLGLTKKEMNAMPPEQLFGLLPALAKLNILDPKTTGIKVGDSLKSKFNGKLLELNPYAYKSITGQVYYRYEGRRKRDNKAIFALVNRFNDLIPNSKGKPDRKYFTMEELDKQFNGKAKGYSNARVVPIKQHYRGDEDDEDFRIMIVKDIHDFDRAIEKYVVAYNNFGEERKKLIKISKEPDFIDHWTATEKGEQPTMMETPLIRVVNKSGVNIGYSALTMRVRYSFYVYENTVSTYIKQVPLPHQLLNEKQFDGILEKFEAKNGFNTGFKIVYPAPDSKYLKNFGEHIDIIQENQTLPRLPQNS